MTLADKEEKTGKTSRVNSSHLINTTGLNFPSGYLSNSQIGLFRICPKAYEFSYIHRMREVRKPSAVVGSSVHKVIETLTSLGKPRFPKEDIISMLQLNVKNETQDILSEYTQEEKGELAFRTLKVIPSLLAYYELELVHQNTLSIESQVDAPITIGARRFNSKTKEITIEPVGSVSVVGFVDAILSDQQVALSTEKDATFIKQAYEGHDLTIMDCKTGEKKSPETMLAQHQLPFYSYATGITNTRMDSIVISRARSEKGIKPGYSILSQQIEPFHIDNMLAEYCSVAYSIGRGYISEAGGYLSENMGFVTDENTFHRISMDHWKCSPKFCGHWYHCRGEKADKYLKAIAIKNYGDVVDKSE